MYHLPHVPIVLTECEKDMQDLLDCHAIWWDKWKLIVNASTSHVVRFRSKSAKKTIYLLKYCDSFLKIVDFCKYLGLYMTEHSNYQLSVVCKRTTL